MSGYDNRWNRFTNHVLSLSLSLKLTWCWSAYSLHINYYTKYIIIEIHCKNIQNVIFSLTCHLWILKNKYMFSIEYVQYLHDTYKTLL